MDKNTGEYVKNIPVEKQANEILEFKLGSKPYGQVRWMGQSLGIDGSRKADVYKRQEQRPEVSTSRLHGCSVYLRPENRL